MPLLLRDRLLIILHKWKGVRQDLKTVLDMFFEDDLWLAKKRLVMNEETIIGQDCHRLVLSLLRNYDIKDTPLMRKSIDTPLLPPIPLVCVSSNKTSGLLFPLPIRFFHFPIPFAY